MANKLWLMAALIGPMGCDQDTHSDNPHSGTSDGNGSDEVVTVPRCDSKKSLLADLNATSSWGTNGQHVLDLAAGSHAFVLENAMVSPHLTITPDSRGVNGRAEIHYLGGQIRAVQSIPVDCSPNVACAGIAVICIDSLEVDAQLKLYSDDNALAEILPITLSWAETADPDYFSIDQAPDHLTLSVQNLKLQGLLRVEHRPALENATNLRHELALRLEFESGFLLPSKIESQLYGEVPGSNGADGLAFATIETVYDLRPQAE